MAPTLQKQLAGAGAADGAGVASSSSAADGVASFSGVTWVQTVSGDDIRLWPAYAAINHFEVTFP